ncbi:hypothetical protein HYX17_02585 [Candidatus Woesearchaeota archaeon]|nr:hypothetical protein [Candidatus Woesearchaeota archaeon]
MNDCPYCGNKLNKFKIGYLYWYNSKRFCSISCKDKYANRHPIKVKKFSQFSTATQTAGIGLLSGFALSILGVILIFIGIILIFTIIGAFIGVILFIIGILMLLVSAIFTSSGILGGLFIKIVQLFEKKKKLK